jgi:hypothetical protein
MKGQEPGAVFDHNALGWGEVEASICSLAVAEKEWETGFTSALLQASPGPCCHGPQAEATPS